MKKLILTTVFSFLYITSASADLGFNVGASGQAGLFSASAKEFSGTTMTEKGNGSEHGEVGFASVFLEATVADRFMVGIDYVPNQLETETTETAKSDKVTSGEETVTARTNTVQIDFEDLTTIYAGFIINENMYVKAGVMTVDVITNENLETGANYANTELDGSMFGVGYHNVLDNGVFFRIEGNYMNFDGTTVTATGTETDSKIQLTSLDGLTGKVSIGKSF